MKSKTMVARGMEGLFVLVAALAIVVVYSLPALADTGTVRYIGLKSSLQLQNLQKVQMINPALMHVGDLSGQDTGSHDGSDSKKSKVRVPVLRHVVSVKDPTHKRTIVRIPNTSLTQETTSTRGSQETTPSRSLQSTPTTTTNRKPHDDDDTPKLPFTGGNSTPFVVAGLLVALAGVGVFVGKRHLLSR